MTQYDGKVKGDRLSALLLYDTTKAMNDSAMLYCPFPIGLGINTGHRYVLAFKFYNPLPCPVYIDDIQLMLCSAYATSSLKYYTDEVLTNVPASKEIVRVYAYTNVVSTNNTLQFKEADVSNAVELPAQTSPNSCYQYVNGATNPNGYDTQFGSLGVYSTSNVQCLSAKKFTFSKLVVQSQTACYFLVKAASYTNAAGGLALWAPEDFRAINMHTTKSNGILKRVNGIWQVATIYKRQNGRWVKKQLPKIEEDTLTAFYPYDNQSTPTDEPTPPPAPAVPDILYDGVNWYVDVTLNNHPTYSYVTYTNSPGQTFIQTDQGKSIEFLIDVTTLKELVFTTWFNAWASYDGYSEATMKITCGTASKSVTFNTGPIPNPNPSLTTIKDIIVDVNSLSGTQHVSVVVGDYKGGGCHPESEVYLCYTQTKVQYVKAVKKS